MSLFNFLSYIAECKDYNIIQSRLKRGSNIEEAILDLESRRRARSPISFYDKETGENIKDTYNNRH